MKLADGDWLALWWPINELAAKENMFLEQRDWILTAWEQWQRAGRVFNWRLSDHQAVVREIPTSACYSASAVIQAV